MICSSDARRACSAEDRNQDVSAYTLMLSLSLSLPLLFSLSLSLSPTPQVTFHTDTEAGLEPPSEGPPLGGFCKLCRAVFTMALAHPLFTSKQHEVLLARLQALENTTEPGGHEDQAAVGAAEASAEGAPMPDGPGHDDSVVDVQVVDVQRSLRIKGDFDFVMAVRWSNGYVGPCRRTYNQFFEFHCALLDQHPEEQNKSTRTMPFLPGQEHRGRWGREREGEVSDT